jgi:GntR family transcriptional regulator
MAQRGKLSIEPLYAQVRNLLAQRIASGVWPPGSMLPNENDLARELGVSSGTVRKALDSLESDRLVVRRQGRGTSVVDQASGEVATRFSNVRDSEGRKIISEMRMLAQTTGTSSEIEQERLKLSPGDPVLRTVRMRRYQGQPFMHESAVLAIGRFPGLEGEGAGHYKISALAQQHGIHLATASERVTVEKASGEIAKHLDLDTATSLLKLERVVRASDGNPVEWRVGMCRLRDGMIYVAEMT